MISKSKRMLIKTAICCFFLINLLSCQSNDEKAKEKIKLSLDSYDKISKDFDTSMRELNKARQGNVSVKEHLDAIKGRCNKINNIDISETPQDFRTAFKKMLSLECDNKNSLADITTYEGDPETKAYNNTIKEVEDISTKYGYAYKHPRF